MAAPTGRCDAGRRGADRRDPPHLIKVADAGAATPPRTAPPPAQWCRGADGVTGWSTCGRGIVTEATAIPLDPWGACADQPPSEPLTIPERQPS